MAAWVNNVADGLTASALSKTTMRQRAPIIFASGPSANASPRYIFVPTARIVDGLGENGWVPVDVEAQRIRTEARRSAEVPLRLEDMFPRAVSEVIQGLSVLALAWYTWPQRCYVVKEQQFGRPQRHPDRILEVQGRLQKRSAIA